MAKVLRHSQDTHVPYQSAWVPFPGPAPHSSFSLMETLGSSGDGSSHWVLAPHARDLDRVPSSQPALAVAGIWKMNRETHRLSLSLSLYCSNDFKDNNDC